jgi:hypothetical protein
MLWSSALMSARVGHGHEQHEKAHCAYLYWLLHVFIQIGSLILHMYSAFVNSLRCVAVCICMFA